MPLAMGDASDWLIMIRRLAFRVLDGEDRATRQEADRERRRY